MKTAGKTELRIYLGVQKPSYMCVEKYTLTDLSINSPNLYVQ